MPNPIFEALGGNRMPASGPMDQFSQMVQQFNQFRSNFQGDPQQKVQELLRSGRMTQQQLDQLQQMARQFQLFLK